MKKLLLKTIQELLKKLVRVYQIKYGHKKKRDINFLISKSFIKNGKALIKISSIKDTSTINLSSFEFSNIGNQKGLQHYKDVLRIIFFDIFAREKDFKKRRILKAAYKF